MLDNLKLFTFHYVSISTCAEPDSTLIIYSFTFHYVSISTEKLLYQLRFY